MDGVLEQYKSAGQILGIGNDLLARRRLLRKAGTAVNGDSGLVHTLRCKGDVD